MVAPFLDTRGGSDPVVVMAKPTERDLTRRAKGVLPTKRASRLGFRTWAPASLRGVALATAPPGAGADVPAAGVRLP
jgi:hypothetical protein